VLIARTPVRVSFGGGGTDLPAYYESYGGAVLNAAINKYFYTVVNARCDSETQVISSDLRVCESWKHVARLNGEAMGHALEIPLAVLKELGCEGGIDLFLASEVPPGSGLGCSASMCVNLLRAICAHMQLALSKNELAARAFHLTANVLGKPVGKQDEYAVAHGGLNFISFARDGTTCVEALNLPPETMCSLERRLMLFFTGTTRDSWSILKEQEMLSRSHQAGALESLHHMRELAYSMRKTLEDGDLAEFARLLHQGWEWKKKISSRISSDWIDRMYELALHHGAAGGKITGAGGGGFMLLYCEEEYQPPVRQALSTEGLSEMRFGFDYSGSSVLLNNSSVNHETVCSPSWNVAPARAKTSFDS
jgi:D-glycero-alpha-D-manno-heptose-7-phosphate kinase